MWFQNLNDLIPHGFCLSWRSDIFWSMAVADSIIALAYISISATIMVFLHRRRLTHFRSVGWLFAGFIMLCAGSHVIDVWTLFYPDYDLQIIELAVTAVVSIGTAILLWILLPRALQIPSTQELEDRVSERTADLERKKELLEQSNSDLEQFAYVASHDLQTPLRNMVRFSQLLSRRYQDKIDADANEFIEFIVTNGIHMTDLIQDLLVYSRVAEAAKNMGTISLRSAIDLALDNLKTLIDESKTTVIIEGADCLIKGEMNLLGSVIQNLTGNGIKYRRSGVLPEISISIMEIENGFCQISIHDNGVGIENQYFEKIFVIFQRLNPIEVEGTGIGLPLCRRIVTHFGGQIWLESSPGEGSTFHFTLKKA